ncbi:l-amino-acid oxidase [Diplocarpon rosae]|nr:l-amino-acid oxidase [Diplocarpon rosae]
MLLRLPPTLVALSALCHHVAGAPTDLPVTFLGPYFSENGGIRSIKLDYPDQFNGILTIAFGPCNASSVEDAWQELGTTYIGEQPDTRYYAKLPPSMLPKKFSWSVPTDRHEGCLLAFRNEKLVGLSAKFTLKDRRPTKRSPTTFAESTDPMGPWFDGVKYLKQKQPSDVFVARSKSSRFGILGAGISGLFTGMILDSVGIHNWTILESSDRLGGRLRTTYLNGTSPDEYQYSDLGAMRFPTAIKNHEKNETIPVMDQRLLNQLVDVLNNFNKNDTSLTIKFIPWIQNSANAPEATSKRRPDGTVPGQAEVAADPSLADQVTFADPKTAGIALDALESLTGFDGARIQAYAKNVFRAHEKAINDGLFRYSEAEYLRNVIKVDLNTADEVALTAHSRPMWAYKKFYLMASEWVSIDKGMDRLPKAFAPLIKDRVKLNTKVHGVRYNKETETLTVKHRPTGSDPLQAENTDEFDYIFNSVPFNLLRFWELPPHSSLMRRAIDRLEYDSAVKVAIQYKERFWEHLEHPIIGGCGAVNIHGIGEICYPSYNINETGPAVLLASYTTWSDARTACAMPEAEHMAYVRRAMVEVHGPIADEMWTGNYVRHCWGHDEHHAGSVAVPTVTQQELYLPAYWKTEFHTVYIGEHTAYTHAWVFSALESAVRGSVQMLLDMGLIDEAKEVTNTWMARWIDL